MHYGFYLYISQLKWATALEFCCWHGHLLPVLWCPMSEHNLLKSGPGIFYVQNLSVACSQESPGILLFYGNGSVAGIHSLTAWPSLKKLNVGRAAKITRQQNENSARHANSLSDVEACKKRLSKNREILTQNCKRITASLAIFHNATDETPFKCDLHDIGIPRVSFWSIATSTWLNVKAFREKDKAFGANTHWKAGTCFLPITRQGVIAIKLS